MKTWLLSRWDALRSAFWFVPLLMVVGAAALSFATLAIDKSATARGVELTVGLTFARGPEGSRALLATVAGSMMTIASVCFSITIVALQQASSQFGPRLLHNFMRDRGNQCVLGTFIAGFTYCLLTLRTVNGTEDAPFVPHLSVTVGLVWALAGVAVLIYFIHHAASSIQAENVIAAVSEDLRDALERLFPQVPAGPVAAGPAPDFAAAAAVPAADSGYLQAVDLDRLLGLAAEHDLTLELAHRPGQFVGRGNPLARAVPADRLTPGLADAVADAFYLGHRRTLLQDVEYAVDQLVEVALRALSPGINDPFTAMACIDRLGAALADAGGRTFPAPLVTDPAGRVRLVARPVTAAGLVGAAFDQIRQAARGNAAVTLRLLEAIAAMAPRALPADMRAALLAEADTIHAGSQDALPADADKAAARGRYRAIRAAFGLAAT